MDRYSSQTREYIKGRVMILLELKRRNVLKITKKLIARILGMNHKTVTKIENNVNARQGSCLD